MDKNTRDFLIVTGSAAVGIIGGIALAELLKKLSQKKCPHCNNMNETNSEYCKICWRKLQ